MSSLWKYVVPVAVVLPLIGFVAGSLLATADDEPPARVPIELRDDGTDDRDDDPVPGGVISPEPYVDEDDDGADDRAEEHDDVGRDLGGDDDGDDGGDDGDDDGEAEDDDDGGDDD